MKLKQLAFFYITCLFAHPVFAQSQASPQEIIYGRKDGMALTMLHLKPTGLNKQKAILRVVSGNWLSGYNNIPNYIEGSKVLYENGYTVFLVMHGSQPRYAIPDMLNDIQRSVRYIRYNAEKYGIDPDHIGITGASSGGNLSLLVATADDKPDEKAKDPVDRVSSRVQAAAVFFPPTDFFNWGGPGFSFMENEQLLTRSKVLGAFKFSEFVDSTWIYQTISDNTIRKKLYTQSSPIYAVTPDDPPVMIIHGDKDLVVPLQQTEIFLAQMKNAKVDTEFILKKDGGHGWPRQSDDMLHFVKWFDKHLVK